MVLVMLKTWFHRSKSGRLPGRPGEGGLDQAATPAASSLPSAQQAHLQEVKREYSPANTPLQLLSEVATGGQISRPNSRNQFVQNEWNGQQYNSIDVRDP